MRTARLLMASAALASMVTLAPTRAMADDDAPVLAGATVGTTTASVADDTCYYTQFCTYRNANYTDIVDRVSSCVLHHSHGNFRSYINNQTPGTRARFYDALVRPTTWTKPAFAKGTTSLGGIDAWYINPCPGQ
jgi:hypothetical protein